MVKGDNGGKKKTNFIRIFKKPRFIRVDYLST
jgi:hypothetical protein